MSKFGWFVIGYLVGGLIGIFVFNCCILDKPTAMDVYQGKTTLDITYRDGVPMDSVVVFKD